MGSGSSKHTATAPTQLTPKAAYRHYPGYKATIMPKERCVYMGNAALADRHPALLELLMLYDTRYAWRDIELEDYRRKLRNVFKGDGEVLKWLYADACKFRLGRGRAYIDRKYRLAENKDFHVMPFAGDPMYGVYVDHLKVYKNLSNMFQARGIRVQNKFIDYQQTFPTNPDAGWHRSVPDLTRPEKIKYMREHR